MTDSMMTCPGCQRGEADARGFCPRCHRPVQRMSERARQVLALASRRAEEDCAYQNMGWWLEQLWMRTVAAVMPQHVLIALALTDNCVGNQALRACGVDTRELVASIEYRGFWGRPKAFVAGERVPVSPEGRALIASAIDHAFSLQHDWVGTEHLLLALIDCKEEVTQRALFVRGVTVPRVRAFIRSHLHEGSGDRTRGPEEV